MAANSRLTIATHALVWLALAQRRGQEVLTSEQVAASVNTNPVIIRRSLGDLRRAGLVDVRRGAGAGWSLAREPEEITLLEVHDAVDAQPPFGLHHTEPNLECPVGRGIRPALSRAYGRVEQAIRRELADTSIADVLRETLTNQPTGR
ncbi:Rrf2 family transcriptional regulator [Streptomyces tibetensis]|uniref:Rrf2 family transcriptional regulator n=1 Tax=Streptomyces tibetensis TaxID=2382123 RepID=UPI0033C54521